jgi:hypothetical protein
LEPLATPSSTEKVEQDLAKLKELVERSLAATNAGAAAKHNSPLAAQK